MVLPLVYFDDPLLRKKAEPIPVITDEIKQLANQMIEAMEYYNGVGLAAPQIGKLLRIYVIREEVLEGGIYRMRPAEVIINPILSDPSEELVFMSEGCLSIPGIHAEVSRPSTIRARYQTLDDKIVEEELSGFRARVFMHENDHLNGVLFVDRLSVSARERLQPALRKLKQRRRALDS